MAAKTLFIVSIAAGLIGVSASGAELQLRAGETGVLPAEGVQGAALDNPRIAEIRISSDSRLHVDAKTSGEGMIAIYSADGTIHRYSLHVAGGEAEGRGAASVPAGFGGKRIPDARCFGPLEDAEAMAAFEDAIDLLRQERTEDAICELDRALIIEPDAAIVHFYLGSAWSKLNDDCRGAFNFETFALSCPDDPKTADVVRMLRDYARLQAAKPGS
jgi:hypothetical protein